jgi:hypothetical protein
VLRTLLPQRSHREQQRADHDEMQQRLTDGRA